MSTFLTPADYPASIHPDLLVRVTGGANGAPNAAVLDAAETAAVALMKGYLSARYDVAAIFRPVAPAPPEDEEEEEEGGDEEDEVADERNPIVVKYAVDITLKFVYDRLPPEQIPESRVYNYEAAIKWLAGVQKQLINPPDLPLVATPDPKAYVVFGGNPKRTNHLL